MSSDRSNESILYHIYGSNAEEELESLLESKKTKGMVLQKIIFEVVHMCTLHS